MEIHTIDKQQMDSMRILAETNMKVSETKNSLITLQQAETDYLVKREVKALDRIKMLFANSADILEQTKNNYKEVREILTWASDLVTYIKEATINFQKLISEFEERDTLWHEEVGRQEEKFETLKRQIKIDQVRIDNDKKSLKREQELVDIDRIKVNDMREELKRAINRLKEK